MARIYQRGRKWWIDYSLNGKRIRQSIADSKMEALLKLKEIKVGVFLNRAENDFEKLLAALVKRENVLIKGLKKFFDIEKSAEGVQKGILHGRYSGEKSLREFVKEYLDYSKVNKAPQTYQEDVYIFKKFLKFIPDKRLSDIEPKDIEDYKVLLTEKNLSSVTVNNYLRSIKAALNMAVKWEYLEKNPGQAVKFLPVQKKLPKFLTVEEIQKLLQAIPPRSYPIIYTLAKTGLRRGEALNLQWQDVDLERNIIKVTESKTYRPRVIPIDEKLKSVLAGLPRKNSKVFEISLSQLKDDFEKARKAAGLNINIHGLRHSFASHLAMSGVSLFSIRDLLGHTNIETTNIYSHLTQEHLQQAVEKLKY